MGTADYMAPEQARDTSKADACADIYSLGMTLWHLATGKVAYPGTSHAEKLLAHESAPVPSLYAALPGVSEMLDAAFSRMVAKLPGDRFKTMDQVVTALERCRHVESTGPSGNITADQ
jgi:serine/threonine protein kinase